MEEKVTYQDKVALAKAQWLGMDSNGDGRVTAKDIAASVTKTLESANVQIASDIVEQATRDILANFYGRPFVDIRRAIIDTEKVQDKEYYLSKIPITSSPVQLIKEILAEIGARLDLNLKSIEPQLVDNPRSFRIPLSIAPAWNAIKDLFSSPDRLNENERAFVPHSVIHQLEEGLRIHDPQQLTPNVLALLLAKADAICDLIPGTTAEGYPIKISFPLGKDHPHNPTYKTATYLQHLFGEDNHLPDVFDNQRLVISIESPHQALRLLNSLNLREEICSIAARLAADYSPYTNVHLSEAEREHLEFKGESPFAGVSEFEEKFAAKLGEGKAGIESGERRL